MPGNMSPEEWRAQRAEWDRNTREFEAMYERLKALDFDAPIMEELENTVRELEAS